MPEPNTVLSPKSFRKELFAERGVTTATVAAEVPCSDEMVRRVWNDEHKWDTDKVKDIKRVSAKQAAETIEFLWPEQQNSSTTA